MNTSLKSAFAAVAAVALALGSAELSAQTRGTTRGGGTTTRNTGSVTRNSGATRAAGAITRNQGTTRGTATTRQSGSSTRSYGSVSRPSGSVGRGTPVTRGNSSSTSTRARGGIISGSTTRGAGSTTRGTVGSGTRNSSGTGSSTRGSGSYGTTNRGSSVTRGSSASSVTRGSGSVTRGSSTSNRGGGVSAARGYNARDSYARQTQGPNDVRFDRGGNRVHPYYRPYMDWDRPGRFYEREPHYFGYRVRYLPHYRRLRYWGIDYYFYNDIWYRWRNGIYVIVRPPYGIGFAIDLYRLELDVLRFAYYNSVWREYRAIDENYSTILEQNRIIAQNNATIAQQNATIAAQQQAAASQPSVDMNTLKSLASYNLAIKLGLVQSYAASDSDYYYDDGVFFVKGADGKYQTIVPPAGALIKALPDDYEAVTLSDGNEYYKVDDTVYRMSVTDGVPYFEVLGQIQSNTVVLK